MLVELDDREERERFQVVYMNMPGGDALQAVADAAAFVFRQQVLLREELAMSGAMRWPWSQEAPIRMRIEVATL